MAFRNELLSIQKLKTSFVFLLWSKAKLFIVNGRSTFVEFIDWVSCVENHRIFLGYSLVYFLPFLYIIFLPFCIFFCFFFVPFFYIYIGVSILCNIHSFNKEKHSFLLSFHRL